MSCFDSFWFDMFLIMVSFSIIYLCWLFLFYFKPDLFLLYFKLFPSSLFYRDSFSWWFHLHFCLYYSVDYLTWFLYYLYFIFGFLPLLCTVMFFKLWKIMVLMHSCMECSPLRVSITLKMWCHNVGASWLVHHRSVSLKKYLSHSVQKFARWRFRYETLHT